MVNLFETKHGGFERNHTLPKFNSSRLKSYQGPNRKPDRLPTSKHHFSGVMSSLLNFGWGGYLMVSGRGPLISKHLQFVESVREPISSVMDENPPPRIRLGFGENSRRTIFKIHHINHCTNYL